MHSGRRINICSMFWLQGRMFCVLLQLCRRGNGRCGSDALGADPADCLTAPSSGCRSQPSDITATSTEKWMALILRTRSRWGRSERSAPAVRLYPVQYCCSRTKWSSSALRATSRSPCWRTTSAKHAALKISCTNTCGSSSSPTMTWREPKGIYQMKLSHCNAAISTQVQVQIYSDCRLYKVLIKIYSFCVCIYKQM